MRTCLRIMLQLALSLQYYARRPSHQRISSFLHFLCYTITTTIGRSDSRYMATNLLDLHILGFIKEFARYQEELPPLFELACYAPIVNASKLGELMKTNKGQDLIKELVKILIDLFRFYNSWHLSCLHTDNFYLFVCKTLIWNHVICFFLNLSSSDSCKNRRVTYLSVRLEPYLLISNP